MNRREALTAAAGLALSGMALPQPAKPKRLAAVNSLYYKLSHAYHIEGRILNGFTYGGKHHKPPLEIARMYNHQYHGEGRYADLSRAAARKHGFPIVETIAEALGGKKSLDVDGVLLICEHGDYPRNALGQIQYPRFEFFQEIVKVFEAAGRSVPVFCDKHLSFDYSKARTMYDTAKKLGFGLMAGSSLPVTWRRPEWEPDIGAKITEAVVCFYADLDIYGIHALETLQCLLERRAGGETGVKSVSALRGQAVWTAWDAGEWSKDLAEAALQRSGSRDFGTPRDHVENPVAFRVEYKDGTRATLLHLPGYVADITAAVRIAGDPKIHSTWFVLPAPPGARFFDPLTINIERFFTTGKSPYPVERTLLTTTMHDFAMRSVSDGKTYTEAALDIRYQPVNESFFARGSYSDA